MARRHVENPAAENTPEPVRPYNRYPALRRHGQRLSRRSLLKKAHERADFTEATDEVRTLTERPSVVGVGLSMTARNRDPHNSKAGLDDRNADATSVGVGPGWRTERWTRSPP